MSGNSHDAFASWLITGVILLEAGAWISFGTGRALMLGGAIVIIGCVLAA